MTATAHRSGSDRVAEAADLLDLGDDDFVLNVQGDQPLFNPLQIKEVLSPLFTDVTLPVSTLIYPIVRDEEITHPHAVKTVFDHEGFALYFHGVPSPSSGIKDNG